MEINEALRILGLNANFTEGQLTKKFKKLVKINHPDLGGSDEAMKRINEARDVALEYLKNGRDSTSTGSSRSSTNREYYQNNRKSTAGHRDNANQAKWNPWENGRHYDRRANYTGYTSDNGSTHKKSEEFKESKPRTGKKDAENPRIRRFYDLEKILNCAYRKCLFRTNLLAAIKIMMFIIIYGVVSVGFILIIDFIFKYTSNSFVSILLAVFVPLVFIKLTLSYVKNVLASIKVTKYKNYLSINLISEDTYTYIQVMQSNKILYSVRVSEKCGFGVWNKVLDSWAELVNCGTFSCAKNSSNLDIEYNFNNCKLMSFYKGLNFNTNCGSHSKFVVLPLMDAKDSFVVIAPYCIIIYNKGKFRVRATDNIGYKVVNTSNYQVVPGRKYNVKPYICTVDCGGLEMFSFAYTRGIDNWDNLIL